MLTYMLNISEGWVVMDGWLDNIPEEYPFSRVTVVLLHSKLRKLDAKSNTSSYCKLFIHISTVVVEGVTTETVSLKVVSPCQ